MSVIVRLPERETICPWIATTAPTGTSPRDAASRPSRRASCMNLRSAGEIFIAVLPVSEDSTAYGSGRSNLFRAQGLDWIDASRAARRDVACQHRGCD